MEERINAYTMLIDNPEGNRPLGDLGVNRRIILKRILRK
jgi:hypothetical protein